MKKSNFHPLVFTGLQCFRASRLKSFSLFTLLLLFNLSGGKFDFSVSHANTRFTNPAALIDDYYWNSLDKATSTDSVLVTDSGIWSLIGLYRKDNSDFPGDIDEQADTVVYVFGIRG